MVYDKGMKNNTTYQTGGENMEYSIGEKIFTAGNEITITTKPYVLYGGYFQDGVDENGKVFTVVPPAQRDADAKRIQDNFKTQQAEFSNMKKIVSNA
jgi:hypothetical protein